MKLTHETLIRSNPAQILLPRFTVSQIMRNDQQVSFRIFFTANHQTFTRDDYIVVKYAQVDSSGQPLTKNGAVQFFKPPSVPRVPADHKDILIFGTLKKSDEGKYEVDWGKYEASVVAEPERSVSRSASSSVTPASQRASVYHASTPAERSARSLTPDEEALMQATLTSVAVDAQTSMSPFPLVPGIEQVTQTVAPQYSDRNLSPFSYIPEVTHRAVEAVNEGSSMMSVVTPHENAIAELEDKNTDESHRELSNQVSNTPNTPLATKAVTEATAGSSNLQPPTDESSKQSGPNYQVSDDGRIVAVDNDGRELRIEVPEQSAEEISKAEETLAEAYSHTNTPEPPKANPKDNYWESKIIYEEDTVRAMTRKEIEKETARAKHLRSQISTKKDRNELNDASDKEPETEDKDHTTDDVEDAEEDAEEGNEEEEEEEEKNEEEQKKEEEEFDKNNPPYVPGGGELSDDFELPEDVPSQSDKPQPEPPSNEIEPSLPSTDPDKTEDPPTVDGGVDAIVPGEKEDVEEEEEEEEPPANDHESVILTVKKPTSRLAAVFTAREREEMSQTPLPGADEEDEEDDNGLADMGEVQDPNAGQDVPTLPDEAPDLPDELEPPQPTNPDPPVIQPTGAYAYGHTRPFQCHFAPGYDTVTGDMVWKVGFGFAGSFDTFEDYVRFLTNSICQRVQEEVAARPKGNGQRIKIDRSEIVDAVAMLAQKRLYFRSNPGYVYCYWGHSTPNMLRLLQAPFYFRNHHATHLYWYLVCATANSTELKDDTYRILIGRHGFPGRAEDIVVISYDSIIIPGNSFFNPMRIEIRDENDRLYDLQVPYIVEWTFTPLRAA